MTDITDSTDLTPAMPLTDTLADPLANPLTNFSEDCSGSLVNAPGAYAVTQAAATVQHWLKPVDENLRLEYLAIDMENALIYEKIDNPYDGAVMMSTHMHVLDTVFNQFLRQSLQYGRYNSIDYKKISFALLAQRQCVNTFEKLNRRRRPCEKDKN